ncbi:MAG: WD40 repeat domain-containing protein, partial [Anaerolineales bacterium]
RLWNVTNGGKVHRLSGPTKQINSLVFSPDGTVLATGGGGEWFTEDSKIRLWRVNDGKLLKTLEDHTGTVWSLSFTPEGAVLASGAGDNTLKLWRVAG